MVDKSFILEWYPTESKGVEIGVWKGEFSKKILETVNPEVLYLCDPWMFAPEYTDRWYGGAIAKSQEDMEEIFQEVVNKFNNYKNITIIRDSSINLLSYIGENTLDWVYIDGNHSYEYVLQDLEVGYKLIKSGGIISGDDYDPGNDVEAAVVKFGETYADYIAGYMVRDRQFLLKINK